MFSSIVRTGECDRRYNIPRETNKVKCVVPTVIKRWRNSWNLDGDGRVYRFPDRVQSRPTGFDLNYDQSLRPPTSTMTGSRCDTPEPVRERERPDVDVVEMLLLRRSQTTDKTQSHGWVQDGRTRSLPAFRALKTDGTSGGRRVQSVWTPLVVVVRGSTDHRNSISVQTS